MNTHTIFLCSTYADLVKEREAILDGIRRLHLLHQSMEFFGARADRPIEVCLDEVRNCDVAIVVVGHLYGTIEPDLQVSFSEAEYQEAYRLRKPCLVYFRDQEVPVLPKHVEQDPIKKALLDKFKKLLQDRHTCGQFRYSEDLAVLVTADLSHAVRELDARLEATVEGHVNILKRGVRHWNAWRVEHRDTKPNLAGANLSGEDLQFTDFYNTDLTGADLSQTILLSASFRGPVLTNAIFRGAMLGETIFVNTDLSSSLGLESANHTVPSFVGVESLYRSQGNIPDSFLRGCRVPEHLVQDSRKSPVEPVQFYSCFLSYSSQDQTFAQQLYEDLRALGIRVWFAPEDLSVGKSFHQQIEESIRLFDKVIVILSDSSVKSRWIQREIEYAREREDRESRSVLFPIRVDDGVMNSEEPWLMEIRRSRHIGDFRGWKSEPFYKKALERLARDLKADEVRLYDPESNRFIDERGRLYRLETLFRPAESSSPHAFDWNGVTPPNGMGWKFSKDKLDALLADGRVNLTKTGPRLRRYSDDKSQAAESGQ